MNKMEVVNTILGKRLDQPVFKEKVDVFAPSNIALCKYWGKRDTELNLPLTDSLSISLGDKGARTQISISPTSEDQITVNHQEIGLDSPFAQRLILFINLFRQTIHPTLQINIHTNIPIAAGLASSACGFASLVKALDQFYNWQLSLENLSILARLGSGSAARSLWNGFVKWNAGIRSDGMDSHGECLNVTWPGLCIGLLIVDESEKSMSSRSAMLHTQLTSPLYQAWPNQVRNDFDKLHQAIMEQDFMLLGKTAESNAMAMHEMMLKASPPISYSSSATTLLQQKIWRLREQGLPIYFTQDAGPNLKCLFMNKDRSTVEQEFDKIIIIYPFEHF